MENEQIVETSSGKIRGYGRRGVFKFKGIPYAAPPVGNLRFKPPAPAAPWTGVLDALEYSPIAPQPASALESLYGEPRPQDEAGCLTLNIWTPGIDRKKRPVLFFIHGGGFITGTGASLDGSRLVSRGDVVVVSINYRLGILGFLYLPDQPDAAPNVGLLDMTAALRFVKDNIANFGGDPDNVTIFGESAGGFAVTSLLALPAANGLFHRAIPQSGAANPLGFNPKGAAEASAKIINKLGIKNYDIGALRKLPAEDLIKAQVAAAEDEEAAISSGRMGRPLRLGPVADGNILPEHPLNAVRNGYARDISLMVGSNLNETKLWNMWNPNADKITEAEVIAGVKGLVSLAGRDEAAAMKMIEAYKQTRKNPRDLMDAVTTDYMFRVPSILLAEAQSAHQKNTFMYLFTWKSPLQGGRYGAMHALELSFVFGVLLDKAIGIMPERTDETQRLSEAMMDAWISFARTGDPNHPGIPKLPSYNKAKRATILLDKEISVVNDPYGQERAAWEEVF